MISTYQKALGNTRLLEMIDFGNDIGVHLSLTIERRSTSTWKQPPLQRLLLLPLSITSAITFPYDVLNVTSHIDILVLL